VGVCPLFSFKGLETDVVDRIRAIAERVAASFGLEVFDVQFRREAPGMVLRVQIDRPGPAATAEESVSVDDCAKISRDLSAILDVEDVVPTAYTLEVSSPGLDRPLRRPDDYTRFAGRRARLVMRVKVDGQTFFLGRLAGLDGDTILLDGDDHKRHRLPLGAVTRANLEVDF
jgi:ribosome maturation factor RimP